jgi:hypothetical protein
MKPISMPVPTDIAKARTIGRPFWTNPTANIAADNPLTEPTDRSIWPSRRTKTIPRAKKPTAVDSMRRLAMLFDERKNGFRLWKIA